MAKAHITTARDTALVRLADGTVKQKNLLTGTEVWTVPGRGHRPLSTPEHAPLPLDLTKDKAYCPFCEKRYLETPPEKARLVRDKDGNWQTLSALPAHDLGSTHAEFRRIPNLFEIVSYNYWHLNHNHVPSETEHRRMAEYLSSEDGYTHVMNVVHSRALALGMTEEEFTELSDSEKLWAANGFFSGGHDVIVARRHFIDGATDDSQLAGSGTLTPEEHLHYINFTLDAMANLYTLNPAVHYVVAFQNWLRPSGASFDHLHKQLVAIDEKPVQTEAEISRLRNNPDIYDYILQVAIRRGLILAQNDHAVAMVGFGHRYPTLAVWPLHAPAKPWQTSPEIIQSVSDLLHACHAATGIDVPTNEEWYHCPADTSVPMRWRILLKWRISTIAGFEGGTRIYLNTIDPWQIHERIQESLYLLRDEGHIAPMRIGEECNVTPAMLHN